MEANSYFFRCSGGIDIKSDLTTHKSWDGEVVGFNMPDGTIVDLYVGLRVTLPDGAEKYIYSVDDMSKYGFDNFDYDELVFIAEKDENPNEND